MYAIANLGARGLSHVAVQVEIEVPLPVRHHIGSPGSRGVAVDAQQNGKRFAPARHEGIRLRRTNPDEWIDASDLNDCIEGNGHRILNQGIVSGRYREGDL